MTDEEKTDSLLGGYCGLDLTDEKGLLCGCIMGMLGAEVIKVEKPGGDTARNKGPFYHDILHPERSLFWFAYNANKKGITLDIESTDGKEIFKQLVEKADFVIESFSPGYMDKLGLGYPALCEINPGIIVTSVSAFGQTGPYKDYKASDIVGMAMSGYMYLCGDTDRPPLRISLPQAYLNAAVDAATGTVIALYHRQISGQGQQVDISMQQSLVMMTMNAVPFWEFDKVILRRGGPYRVGLSSGASQRQVWRCKDGMVTFVIFGGRTGAKTNRELVKWMDGEGMAVEFLKEIDWDNFDMATATQDFWDRAEAVIGSFLLNHTKVELSQRAQESGILLTPISTPGEILENPQFKARQFWTEVEHPELDDTITYPGAFIKASETPLRINRRAPLIGEHNMEIYQQWLGLSSEDLVMLKQGGVI